MYIDVYHMYIHVYGQVVRIPDGLSHSGKARPRPRLGGAPLDSEAPKKLAPGHSKARVQPVKFARKGHSSQKQTSAANWQWGVLSLRLLRKITVYLLVDHLDYLGIT